MILCKFSNFLLLRFSYFFLIKSSPIIIFLIGIAISFFEVGICEDLITVEDLHLLENYELRLLRDFVRGKGRGTISRADPQALKEDDNPLADLGPQKSSSNTNENQDPDVVVLDGQFAPIIPKLMTSPHIINNNNTKNTNSSRKNSLEKIYFINPQKINAKPSSTMNKSSSKNSQQNQSEENKDLSNEDYEKLAKILQQFVSRRKIPKSQQLEEKSREEIRKKAFLDSQKRASKKPIEIIYLPPTSNIPLTSSNTETSTVKQSTDSEFMNSIQSWNGSVEKVAISKSPSEIPKEIIHERNNEQEEPNAISSSPIHSQILGRIPFQPSQKQQQTSQQKKEPLKEDFITENEETFVQITGEKSPNKLNMDKKEEDLELKIREISQELTSVLHKLKREKYVDGNLIKGSYSIKNTSVEIPDNNKNIISSKNSKAYVTIIREGLARQSGSNQYSFVASITLIRDQGKIILVDTGLGTDINGRTDLIKQLTKLNIAPPRVNYVITTHGHSDHAGNTNEFPDAVHFQGTIAYHRNKFNFTDLFENDVLQLTSNVHLIKTPGHTSEDLAVLVYNTDKYGTMAVAGDVFMAFEDLDYPMMWRPLAWNEKIQEESRKILICMADYIVPGHGKVFHVTEKLRARFPCNSNAKNWLKVHI